jgi:hypothetical protein
MDDGLSIERYRQGHVRRMTEADRTAAATDRFEEYRIPTFLFGSQYASRETDMDRSAIIENYMDGECLTLAFAVHWMTGWKVVGVEEGDDIVHFAAVDPDGLAWDAAGPRPAEDAATAYSGSARLIDVDAMKYLTSCDMVDEDAITRACHAAIAIFGEEFEAHVTRRPETTDSPGP